MSWSTGTVTRIRSWSAVCALLIKVVWSICERVLIINTSAASNWLLRELSSASMVCEIGVVQQFTKANSSKLNAGKWGYVGKHTDDPTDDTSTSSDACSTSSSSFTVAIQHHRSPWKAGDWRFALMAKLFVGNKPVGESLIKTRACCSETQFDRCALSSRLFKASANSVSLWNIFGVIR